jgi:methylenetetrahydrofolate reductase (NADPH)
MAGQKIIDIINQNISDNKTFFSFEYFPPKTEKGVENLYERLERMSLYKPAWIDVTWGAGGSTSDLTLEICTNAQKYIGLETMMHLTCTNMQKEKIDSALKQAKEAGIRNILALRGDPPRGEEWKKIEGGFGYAADLVRYIRQEYGNYFGICVAGYPEGHVDAQSYEEDLKNLKEKMDAGADCIITQLFYDTDLFLKYVDDCRKLGIKAPIVPGIMPIHTYAGFDRMTTLCKTHVPQKIKDALEPIKNDDEAVKNYGIQLCIEMCRTLLKAGTPCLHFYTLNLEKSVLGILQGLQIIEEEVRKPLPWLPVSSRAKETVRPIFWSHRPKSYIQRTSSWDEFPNGRWGDSRSPAFGDLTDFHISDLHIAKSFDKKGHWGAAPATSQEIYDVFAKYCGGEIERLPWCDTPLSPESDTIKNELIKINKAGFLTINSQPKVNGVPSSDEKNGWGPKNGYVYQKAYIEFFTSEENYKFLIEAIKKFPALTYYAVNIKGELQSNTTPQVCALTWGVFPGKEISQPTVVDPDSFMVWKDEAYALWKSVWGSLYPEDSPSRKLIDNIAENYYLISMVDNDFVKGNIFDVFDVVIKQKAN